MLLYWKISGDFQHARVTDATEKLMQLVQCWILGDKYDIKKFQDLVMLELIKDMESQDVPWIIAKVAFENTCNKVPLRTLLAQVIVAKYFSGNNTRDLEEFDGVRGFIAELMKAIALKDKSKRGSNGLKVNLNDSGTWEKFMVGGGPKKHWIHDL